MFKPQVWQKQVFAGRNPTLLIKSMPNSTSTAYFHSHVAAQVEN